ncbi:UDP-glucose 6-dehydrogenase [Planococcus glaciei]|uniref:UDP-glucose dehydrogenase family protein n=1 Tax=Planococcus glaciei TaxID=459472 RepID=UPI00069D1FD4|nr:UDP-glucose/GDP-mannose dehydrogenase family protein [Planococcus glaciei]KOF09021.1 UDP-glucose 6-dehydrogenase [Planococcus glaciei]
MKITVVGAGYVGLTTSVCLSEIGHEVTCVDVDQIKIDKMKQGYVPIYEPGLKDLMLKNIRKNRLFFSTEHKKSFLYAEVIYIAVGTPENADGSANLKAVEQVAKSIASYIQQSTVVVIKSTVPVGTNEKVKQIIQQNLENQVKVDVVSNPEFLREGSAVYDSFNGDRIVIGAEQKEAADLLAEINRSFGIPIYQTDVKSAEMIKYASNAFLATKISFINEISNVCELLGADVEDVAVGMGLDKRIGIDFLKAGIGYGGSCFPKDTKALIQIAGNVNYDFKLLKGVVEVNKQQQGLLVKKVIERLGSLGGKKISVLGLSFKPNTDDMREAASILIINELIKLGAEVIGYDPVAIDNARLALEGSAQFTESLEVALENSDAALIVTEWPEIKNIDINLFEKMKNPLVIDGRNCFSLDFMKSYGVEYHSIGRPSVIGRKIDIFV